MYARVPAIDGVPQVGAVRLTAGVSISDTEAVVIVDAIQPGWVELTEEEYLSAGGIIPQKERITQLAEIQENQLIIMDALATIYEELLMKGVI
jgi:hypothetical protein